jgi:hypothetical protein
MRLTFSDSRFSIDPPLGRVREQMPGFVGNGLGDFIAFNACIHFHHLMAVTFFQQERFAQTDLALVKDSMLFHIDSPFNACNDCNAK